jgi:hypothetical protein
MKFSTDSKLSLFFALAPRNSVPNPFMDKIRYSCVQVTNNHEQECDAGAFGKYVYENEVQYDDYHPISYCFD